MSFPFFITDNKKINSALYSLIEFFDNSYIIDLFKYGPEIDEKVRENYFLHNHMNAMGYILFAKMVDSYIDNIIRTKPQEFYNVPFINSGN